MSDQDKTENKMIRDITSQERDAAIFLIGVDAAFNLRGYPSSYPRKLFNSAVKDALSIAGEVGKVTRVGQLDYPAMRSMLEVARTFGFGSVRSAPSKTSGD